MHVLPWKQFCVSRKNRSTSFFIWEKTPSPSVENGAASSNNSVSCLPCSWKIHPSHRHDQRNVATTSELPLASASCRDLQLTPWLGKAFGHLLALFNVSRRTSCDRFSSRFRHLHPPSAPSAARRPCVSFSNRTSPGIRKKDPQECTRHPVLNMPLVYLLLSSALLTSIPSNRGM